MTSYNTPPSDGKPTPRNTFQITPEHGNPFIVPVQKEKILPRTLLSHRRCSPITPFTSPVFFPLGGTRFTKLCHARHIGPPRPALLLVTRRGLFLARSAYIKPRHYELLQLFIHSLQVSLLRSRAIAEADLQHRIHATRRLVPLEIFLRRATLSRLNESRVCRQNPTHTIHRGNFPVILLPFAGEIVDASRRSRPLLQASHAVFHITISDTSKPSVYSLLSPQRSRVRASSRIRNVAISTDTYGTFTRKDFLYCPRS